MIDPLDFEALTGFHNKVLDKIIPLLVEKMKHAYILLFFSFFITIGVFTLGSVGPTKYKKMWRPSIKVKLIEFY